MTDPLILPNGDVIANTSCCGGDPASLVQDAWHVNVTGNNNYSGKTAATAVKTVTAIGGRIGKGNTLRPVSGFVDLYFDSDLPSSDPLTLDFVAKAIVRVHCKKTVVRSNGTIANTVVQNFTTSTPNQFKDPAVPSASYWADKIGMFVVCTTGPAAGAWAPVIKDQGLKVVRLGDWAADDGQGIGGTIPALVAYGATPGNGDKYDVVKYSSFYLGDLRVSADPSYIPPGGIISPAGIVFIGFRVADAGSDGPPVSAAGWAIRSLGKIPGTTETNISYQQGTFEGLTEVDVSVSRNVMLSVGGCAFRRRPLINGVMFQVSNATIPYDDESYPSGGVVQTTGSLSADRCIYQGTGVGGAPDIFFNGLTCPQLGALGFIDCERAVVCQSSSTITFGLGFYGDNTSTVWGSGNNSQLEIDTVGSSIAVFRDALGSGDPVVLLPLTITNLAGPEFISMGYTTGYPVASSTESNAFDPTAVQPWTANRPNTPAKLVAAVGAGGFAEVSTPNRLISSMIKPQTGNAFSFFAQN